MRRGQTEEQIPVNSALLNVVTPMGLEFQKNRLSVGESWKDLWDHTLSTEGRCRMAFKADEYTKYLSVNRISSGR